MTTSRVLHEVDFTKVTNLKEYLKKYPHWVYCVVNGQNKFARDEDDSEIYKRVYKNKDGYLEFMRKAEERDHDGLRPRIEIVPRTLLPKNTPIHVRYEVSFLEGGLKFRGMVFQFMDHTKSNKTYASFQFELRDGNLHTRWLDSNKSQHIHKIATPKWPTTAGGSKGEVDWYNLDVYAILSADKSKGVFRVYMSVSRTGETPMNGKPRSGEGTSKFVWEYRGISATDSDKKVQIQYGIYAVSGVKYRTQVRKLIWETVDKIPDSITLASETRRETT